jgi:hypothetical protein
MYRTTDAWKAVCPSSSKREGDMIKCTYIVSFFDSLAYLERKIKPLFHERIYY